MKNLGYYNGILDEIENVKIPMGDRVCFFGDGVYDATYTKNYKIFALDEHVDRFFNSANFLSINIPISKQELKSLLKTLLKKMDTGENFLYFQVTRSTISTRTHCFLDTEKANLWVNIYPKKIADLNQRVKLITLEDTRFLHCNIKTLNLIPSVMASKKALELGADEVVFHRNGRVTECAHSNVHIIKDGILKTAPTDNLILPGIARAHIIKGCKALKIPVIERPFSLEELYFADEVIISSAGQLCLSASQIDKVKVGGKSQKILKTLQEYLYNEFIEQTKKE